MSYELNVSEPPRLKYNPDNGRFIKGHPPWNKGKKGLNLGGKQTQFKIGNLPHNTLYDGAISIRFYKKDNKYYKYIRVQKGKWQLLQRFIWEQKYGEIPKGFILRFKDGDTMNCEINNLEMIRRRENMKRNRNSQKAGERMAELWHQEKFRTKYGFERQTKLKININKL
jgi:hypothetical protein